MTLRRRISVCKAPFMTGGGGRIEAYRGGAMGNKHLIPVERIEGRILLIRKEQVMLDSDLASLYGVATRNLVQAVRRNKERFPSDFMFRLDREEYRLLTSQSVMSNGRGGRRHLPYVFTEQGVAMLSSVLRSKKAISVNVKIMRAFVRLRRLLDENKELARRLDEHDRQLEEHGAIITVLVEEYKKLTSPPDKPRRKIGL